MTVSTNRGNGRSERNGIAADAPTGRAGREEARGGASARPAAKAAPTGFYARPAAFPAPVIVIDTREQTPLLFPDGVATVRGTLATGDYSVRGYEGEFTVERKSLEDLVNTVIHDRARFERELERMGAFAFRRLLVVAPFERVRLGDREGGGYRFSMANPRSVVASVTAFEVRYGVSAVFAPTPAEAARRVATWAWYYVRECARATAPPTA